MTEPTVGASACASKSHKCTGIIGIFTLNDKKNKIQRRICRSNEKL
jgi:hypothetical protein